MPTLNWIGKDKVVNHHRDVPYRVLEHQYGFSDGQQTQSESTASGNLIINGDNLEALKALLPKYEDKIKCIYIDPPYNTGKDEWAYSDRVNHPKILEWLDKIVGKEGEDLTRHDKWLCMIYPRIRLLHSFLKEDGVFVASIDNNELYYFKIILDEIFGRGNFLGNIIWKNVTDNNPTQIADEHEYLIVYAKNKDAQPSEWKSPNLDIKDKLLNLESEMLFNHQDLDTLQKEYSKWFKANKPFMWPFDRYKYIDKGGIYTGSQSVHNPGKEGYRYDIIHPETKKPCKEPLMGYRFPPDSMKKLLDDERIIFGTDHNKIVELKLYVKDYRAKLPSVIEIDGRIGSYTLKSILNQDKLPFKNPKTVGLLEEVLSFITKDDDIILDSFAGSGTTAHAVLNLNKEDGGNRKFILVEMEDYADTITAERVKRVTSGYGEGNNATIGTGGSFDYYKLGQLLFVGNGQEFLNEDIPESKIREYIWYSETRSAFLEIENLADAQGFLGQSQNTAYYFVYQKNELTTLDLPFLASIKTKAEQYVIYADNCLLSKEFMAKHNIIFKKIPRDISRF